MKISFALLSVLSLSLASCGPAPKKEVAPPAPATPAEAAPSDSGLSIPTVEVGATPKGESGLSVPSVEIGGKPVSAPQ